MLNNDVYKGQNKMYNYAKCHAGIDTLKFKLEPINSNLETNDLLNLLKDHFRSALNDDDTERVCFDDDQRAWLIFAQKGIVSDYPIGRFYHLGKGPMYVELFGIFQSYDGSILKLNESHATILKLLSDLKNIFIFSITKLDLAIDYFYDYKKSFVYYYVESKENDINIIKKQNYHAISYLGNFPMHTVEVPINRVDIIDFIEESKRKIKRKNVGEKRPEGSYFRFGTFKSYGIFKAFSECEKDDATHIQLKITEKNIFYEAKKLFKGKETWSYDFDETEDVRFSKSAQKSSLISYDKTQRDADRERNNKSEKHTYEKIRLEYANNNEDLAKDLSHDFKHTRIELRVKNPGVTRGGQPLDPTEENTWQKIFDDLEKRIKQITIVLIRPDVSNGVYIEYCKRMQELQKQKFEANQNKLKQTKGAEFTPYEFKPKIVAPNKYTHGKMLKPIENVDSVKSKLDIIKSFFVS